jgi:hypothetical protein
MEEAYDHYYYFSTERKEKKKHTHNIRKCLQTYIRVCKTRSLRMLHSMLVHNTHALA